MASLCLARREDFWEWRGRREWREFELLLPKRVEAWEGKPCWEHRVENMLAGTEVSSFGYGGDGLLGHGDQRRSALCLVEALAGKQAVGALAGHGHIVVWIERSECFTFGRGGWGQLGPGRNRFLFLAPQGDTPVRITHFRVGDS